MKSLQSVLPVLLCTKSLQKSTSCPTVYEIFTKVYFLSYCVRNLYKSLLPVLLCTKSLQSVLPVLLCMKSLQSVLPVLLCMKSLQSVLPVLLCTKSLHGECTSYLTVTAVSQTTVKKKFFPQI